MTIENTNAENSQNSENISLVAAVKLAQDEVHAARKANQDLTTEWEHASAKATTARRNEYATLDKWVAEVQRLSDALVANHARTVAAEQALAAAEEALRIKRASRLLDRLNAIMALASDADMNLTGQAGEWTDWRGARYTLQLTTAQAALDGQPASPRVRRFGYEVEIYGPELRAHGWDRTHNRTAYAWRDSQVNWGTLGSLSVADAQDMLRLHTAAVRIAAFLDEVRDTWYAEDMAD